MGRFQRGKLAVLVWTERTYYADRPNESRERAELYVVTSVARDGSTPRKVRDVHVPGRDYGTPYVSETDHNAANVRGVWHPVNAPHVEALDVASSLDHVTDGHPWMATPADMRAAIRWAMHGFYPGAEVFVTGQLGTVESANDNGSYVVNLAAGYNVVARAHEMAHR